MRYNKILLLSICTRCKKYFLWKKISKWAKAFRNNSILPVHHRPNSPHSSLRSRILIYILQYTKWKFGPKSVRVGSCGVKKCGVMTPVTLASATSLVESGLVSVNLKGPWKSRRIYPKYMPKCSVGFTDHVGNFLPKNIKWCGRYNLFSQKLFLWRQFGGF